VPFSPAISLLAPENCVVLILVRNCKKMTVAVTYLLSEERVSMMRLKGRQQRRRAGRQMNVSPPVSQKKKKKRERKRKSCMAPGETGLLPFSGNPKERSF
jgi:hypothetical protein